MRRVLALGLLAFVLPLAGCGRSGTAALAPTPTAAHASVPSGLVASPPEIADPVCNGGHGVRLSNGTTPFTGGQGDVHTSMGDGSTMFAYNVRRSLVLVSLAGNCTLNRRFAHDGIATIRGTHLHSWLEVEAVAPTVEGYVIVAGFHRNRPAVGLVNARGKVVTSFGTGGRVSLPFCSSAGGVTQEPNWPFHIIVSGSRDATGRCNSDWIAALSEHGRFLRRFGHGGREPVPTYGADSGVGSPEVEPNGDILVEIGFGNSGCWGYALRMYSPAGHERAEFTQRWNRFWKKLGWFAFSGEVYTDGNGFTLVGTGQKPCAAGPPLFEKHVGPRGLVVHFRGNGGVASPPIRFRSPMFGAVSGFKLGRDTLVIGAPYANASTLHLTAVLPNGSLDPWFGNSGRAEVRAPWRGQYAAMDAEATFAQVGTRAVLIVAADGGYHPVEAIRIRAVGRSVRPPLLPTTSDPDSVARFPCELRDTVGIESCQSRRLLVLNRRVNALIQTLWRGLDDSGRRYLTQAQQAWETYVSNECTSRSGAWVTRKSPHFYVGGTSAPIRYGDCAIKLTRARILDLRTWKAEAPG